MATKTVTYCDITQEVCSQTYRIGMSDDSSSEYIIELSEQGLKTLLGELIANINQDALGDILTRLVGSNWKKTLRRDA